MTTVASCIQTATTECLSVPLKGLHSVDIGYVGNGTQPLDVAIVIAICVAVLIFAAIVALSMERI